MPMPSKTMAGASTRSGCRATRQIRATPRGNLRRQRWDYQSNPAEAVKSKTFAAKTGFVSYTRGYQPPVEQMPARQRIHEFALPTRVPRRWLAVTVAHAA